MTRRRQIAHLNAIATLKSRIAEIDTVIHEIAVSGTYSASVSAGSGSKSYSRLSLSELRAERADLVAQLRAHQAALRGNVSGIRRIVTVRS